MLTSGEIAGNVADWREGLEFVTREGLTEQVEAQRYGPDYNFEPESLSGDINQHQAVWPATLKKPSARLRAYRCRPLRIRSSLTVAAPLFWIALLSSTYIGLEPSVTNPLRRTSRLM